MSSKQCASDDDDDIIHLPIALSSGLKHRNRNLVPIAAQPLKDLVRKTSLLPNQTPAPETVLLLHSHAQDREESTAKISETASSSLSSSSTSVAPTTVSSSAADPTATSHLNDDPRTTQSALHLISQLPLPRLQSDTTNIHSWLTIFEAACSRVGVPRAHWPASLLFHISPDLFAWVVSLHAPSGVAKHDEWQLVHRPAIVSRFHRPCPPGVAPWTLMRQNGKPVQQYAIEWETASVGWLGMPKDEQWQVATFIASLDQVDRAKVQGRACSSIGDVVAAVRRFAKVPSPRLCADSVRKGTTDVEMVDVSDEDEDSVDNMREGSRMAGDRPLVSGHAVVVDSDVSDVEMIELTAEDHNELPPPAPMPFRTSKSPPPTTLTSSISSKSPVPPASCTATIHIATSSSSASIALASPDHTTNPPIEPSAKFTSASAPALQAVKESSSLPATLPPKPSTTPHGPATGYANRATTIHISGSKPSTVTQPDQASPSVSKPHDNRVPIPPSTASSSSSLSSSLKTAAAAASASSTPPAPTPVKFVPIVWPDEKSSNPVAKSKFKSGNVTLHVVAGGASSAPNKPVHSVGKAAATGPAIIVPPSSTPKLPNLLTSNPPVIPAPVVPPARVSAACSSAIPPATQRSLVEIPNPATRTQVVGKLMPPNLAIPEPTLASIGSNSESVSALKHLSSTSASAAPTSSPPASNPLPAKSNHWNRVTRPRSISPVSCNSAQAGSGEPLTNRPRTTTSPARLSRNEPLAPAFRSVPASLPYSTCNSPPRSPGTDRAAPKLMFKFIDESDHEPVQGDVGTRATLPKIAFVDEEPVPASVPSSRLGIQFLDEKQVEPVGGAQDASKLNSPAPQPSSPIQVFIPFKFVASPSPDHTQNSRSHSNGPALISHSTCTTQEYSTPSELPSVTSVVPSSTFTHSPERMAFSTRHSRPASVASNSSAASASTSIASSHPDPATASPAHSLRHWRLRILTNRALATHFSAGIWNFTRDPRPEEIIDHVSPNDKWSTVVHRAMHAARIDRDGPPAQVWVLDRVNKAHGMAAYERHALSVVDGKYHPFARDRDVPLRYLVKAYGVDVEPMFTTTAGPGSRDTKPAADVVLYIEQMPNTSAGNAWVRTQFSDTSVAKFVPVFIKVYDPPLYRRRSRSGFDEQWDMCVSDFRTVGMTAMNRNMPVSSLFAAIRVLSGEREVGKEKYWLWIEAAVAKDGDGIGLGNRIREDRVWRECTVPWGGVILARQVDG